MRIHSFLYCLCVWVEFGLAGIGIGAFIVTPNPWLMGAAFSCLGLGIFDCIKYSKVLDRGTK